MQKWVCIKMLDLTEEQFHVHSLTQCCCCNCALEPLGETLPLSPSMPPLPPSPFSIGGEMLDSGERVRHYWEAENTLTHTHAHQDTLSVTHFRLCEIRGGGFNNITKVKRCCDDELLFWRTGARTVNRRFRSSPRCFPTSRGPIFFS